MDGKASLGSLGVGAYLRNPLVPTILAEWAALIPLIVHLASSQSDYDMVGEAALEGRITTGLLPKLGHLDGIARLLSGGLSFLERASTKGCLDSTVWDVSWGSIFPCANGAAREILTNYALRKAPRVVEVENWLDKKGAPKENHYPPQLRLNVNLLSPERGEDKHVLAGISDARSCQKPTVRLLSSPDLDAKCKQRFRRPQTLHVVKLTRGTSRVSWRSKFDVFIESKIADVLYVLLLLAAATLLCLFGAYGTGSIVLSRATSRFACHCLPIQRTPGYLMSNETHDACMLTAVHQNASTWFLYTGDRAVVDWLLNKTMFTIGPSKMALYYYFRLAHFFQILAMTYVAAQKGWDGICLLFLMLVAWTGHWSFGRHRSIKKWLRKEQIQFSAHSFELTGRTPMIGAIQLLVDKRNLSGLNGLPGARNTAWMDEIVAPCTRRDIWTQRLLNTAKNAEIDCKDCEAVDDADKSWVENNTRWSIEALDCIQTLMDKAEETGA